MVVISVRSLVPNAKGITYIGRSCSGWKPSVLGNPHHVGGECPTCGNGRERDHEKTRQLTTIRYGKQAEELRPGNGEGDADSARL